MRRSGAPVGVAIATRLWWCALGAPGCLLTSPLELEPPAENRPPYLDVTQAIPAERLVIATGPETFELTVLQAFDPDDEPELYFAWFSPALGVPSAGRLRPEVGQPRTDDGRFRRYEGESLTLTPCAPALTGRDTITVWFFLTDRPFERQGPDGVEARFSENAGLSSVAWSIDLSNVSCVS